MFPGLGNSTGVHSDAGQKAGLGVGISLACVALIGVAAALVYIFYWKR